MKHIEVSMFPEFTYMVYIVGAVIALGLFAAWLNKRFMLVTYALVILCCGIAALVDFYRWGYDYGHNLDPTAAIIVPGMSYQPPLIGTKQLLNFTAFSGPDVGGWIFMVSGILAFAALAFEVYSNKRFKKHTSRVITFMVLSTLTVVSCAIKPEPIQYGVDACYHCKMIMMDQHFGAEVVSKTGKIFKFDDMNCMIGFMKSNQLPERDVVHYLVTDFANPATLVQATTAFYVRAEEVKSPMASNVAAFASQENSDRYRKTWIGEQLTWNDLLTE